MDQGEVTRLLDEIGARCDGAVDRLYPLVYDELRRLAQSAMGREPAGHTLQATALVHEAYLKLPGLLSGDKFTQYNPTASAFLPYEVPAHWNTSFGCLLAIIPKRGFCDYAPQPSR